MTPSNARLLSFAITRGQRTGNWSLACKVAMLSQVQRSGNVILGDAYMLLRDHLTSHEWAGYLSGLAAAGFYTPNTDPDYRAWGHINSQA